MAPPSRSVRAASNRWVVGSTRAIGWSTGGSSAIGTKTPDNGMTTNRIPQASTSALWPNRSTSPMTNNEIDQPTTSSNPPMGRRPQPTSRMSNE